MKKGLTTFKNAKTAWENFLKWNEEKERLEHMEKFAWYHDIDKDRQREKITYYNSEFETAAVDVAENLNTVQKRCTARLMSLHDVYKLIKEEIFDFYPNIPKKALENVSFRLNCYNGKFPTAYTKKGTPDSTHVYGYIHNGVPVITGFMRYFATYKSERTGTENLLIALAKYYNCEYALKEIIKK